MVVGRIWLEEVKNNYQTDRIKGCGKINGKNQLKAVEPKAKFKNIEAVKNLSSNCKIKFLNEIIDGKITLVTATGRWK